MIYSKKCYGNINKSGQISSIIPKPELRGFWRDSLPKPQFKVASAAVVIICPERFIYIYIYYIYLFITLYIYLNIYIYNIV